jgi:hypothetical protein
MLSGATMNHEAIGVSAGRAANTAAGTGFAIGRIPAASVVEFSIGVLIAILAGKEFLGGFLGFGVHVACSSCFVFSSDTLNLFIRDPKSRRFSTIFTAGAKADWWLVSSIGSHIILK